MAVYNTHLSAEEINDQEDAREAYKESLWGDDEEAPPADFPQAEQAEMLLHFSGDFLSVFDRACVFNLIYDVLGVQTDCQVYFEGCCAHLKSPRKEDLIRIAEAAHQYGCLSTMK